MMKYKLSRLTAVCLGVLMVPVFPAAVNAEEEVVKNYDYYAALSDYEVYADFYDTFGRIAEGTLPDEASLPYYSLLLGDSAYFYVFCTEEWTQSDANDAVRNPELFGLPADWYAEEENSVLVDGEQAGTSIRQYSVAEMGTQAETTEIDGVVYHSYDVQYSFQNVSHFTEDFDINSTIDKYRIILPLWNAGILKTYGVQDKDSSYYGIYEVYEDDGDDGGAVTVLYGDINKDGAVDASDAACILQYAAAVGAGYTGTLEEYAAETA